MKSSQKIIDYAIWYYLKYYPSPKRLEEKLKEKFWPNSEKWQKYGWINDDEINFIIKEKLKNIIIEDEVIKAKINSYKNKKKSKKYILQKMFFRKENMDLVNKYIIELFNENDELEQIKILLKRFKYWDNLEFEEKQKILGKILRKWYSYNDIKKVI